MGAGENLLALAMILTGVGPSIQSVQSSQWGRIDGLLSSLGRMVGSSLGCMIRMDR